MATTENEQLAPHAILWRYGYVVLDWDDVRHCGEQSGKSVPFMEVDRVRDPST